MKLEGKVGKKERGRKRGMSQEGEKDGERKNKRGWYKKKQTLMREGR